MRIDKLIADAAALTRTQARKAIKSGFVKVDNVTICDIASHISENSRVTIYDKEIIYKKFK